ncbi:serine/threonine-protein phosphatase 2A 56 kDa regulatory subunit epsilon isoform [Tritrichomonas foetus]|uniref:Serine/threonine-protein phosphatase 2A 56 kDa regulatory subunit epsilon isoform n=1 Tax=Tritrichomonas foetus TaxID=1144522 RepID=A0A1J4JIM3_9EUKA|nr:serine/threonine-protein phosphatase 2A 56 kDa regulatory subunit epsilon isoform [Tritrichomonas foetus]|eukprot:OHS98183.1 serine/threonine-protein phosphatase 2A 56 kDa regulatory subunit epsilon isoform [Tritrichomonas foetus]
MNPAFFFNRRSASSRFEKPAREVEPNRRSISAILGSSRSPNVLNPRSRLQICVPQPIGQGSPFNFSSSISNSNNNVTSNSVFMPSSTNLQFSYSIKQDSSVRLVGRTNDSNNSNRNNFSTHGHILSDVTSLIDRVYSANYKFDISISPSNDLKTDDIEAIIAFISQPGVLMTFDADTTEKLLDMTQKYLIRNIKDIPKPLIYGDTYSPLYVSNWQALNFIHRLTSILFRVLDSAVLDRWTNEKFIIGLVSMFQSPDQNEQSSLLVLLQQLFDKFTHKQSLIFNNMLKMIIGHIEGIFTFVCIPPILSFFRQFFTLNLNGWNPNFKNTFRCVFFRLFSTDFVCEYYQQLSSLCQLFYQNDSSLAIFALEFLLKHWPKSNSTKNVIYIHQISVLAPSLRLSGTEKSIIRMFAMIGASLTSYNFKVASAAIQVCGDPNFICLFTPFFPVVIPPLLRQLSLLTEHWNCDVKNKMKDAFQVIYAIDSRLDKTRINPNLSTTVSMPANGDEMNGGFSGEKYADKVRGKWMEVYQSAISVNPAFPTDIVRKNIMLIE